MAEWNPKANDIFLRAAEIESSAERSAYLDGECADEPRLRHQVESLLAASDKVGSFLAQPAISPHGASEETAAYQPIREVAGTVIGPYKLLEQIGEGGFGVVFMAEQTEPVRRKVALKVLKPGMDTRQVVARFEAERQALAIMDHPNIAKVLDGGATASGRPYFVMDLVKGVPITEHCDQNHLSPRGRLELFVSVCQAVQHAHQKGIVHRDLKPSNVLVTMHDTTPLVKVIDFGVAKALGQELTDKTLFTGFAQMIGTPLYMSPEQAGQSNLDIDTRSDIYSLGVLLYELLTGTTPFDKDRFKQAAYDEIRRIIREEEPPKPSTRLSTTDELPSIAANRKTEPRKLSGLVRGELDWIVMKALEKDRNRRYETANSFAMDVQRYLADEPVQACPPSAGYRFRKFLRRRKGPVLAATLLIAVLLAGTIGTSLGLFQARAERDQKELARQEAVANEAKAVAAAEKERRAKDAEALQRKRAEAVAELLESVFHEVDPRADWKQSTELKVRLLDRLDAAASRLDRDFAGDPLTRAHLQNTLAETQLTLGEARKALALLEPAVKEQQEQLGNEHPDVLQSKFNVARAYLALGQLDRAVLLFEENVSKRKTHLPADDPYTLQSMFNLAWAYHLAGKLEKAMPLYVECLEKQTEALGPDNIETMVSMNNLGLAYLDIGKFRKAQTLFEQLLERQTAKLGSDHFDTVTTMGNLGMAHDDAGNFKLALPLFEQALEKFKVKVGLDHPHTLGALNNLASTYRALGDHQKALPLNQLSLERRKARFGSDHPSTLLAMNNLASTYLAVKQPAKATPLFEEVLEIAKRQLGPSHPNTLSTMNNLAMAYRDGGQFEKALALIQQTVEMRKSELGFDHPETIVSMNNLALVYGDLELWEKALGLFHQTLELQATKMGPDHPATLTTMINLAKTYWDAGQVEEALPIYEQVLERRKTRLGPDDPRTINIMLILAEAYHATGEYDTSSLQMRELIERLRRKEGSDGPLAAALERLANNLLKQQRLAEAENHLLESLAISERRAPESWMTSNTRSLLGAALVGQERYAEAETHLIRAFEGMRRSEAQIPVCDKSRLVDAAARVVQLFEAWGKKEEADTWRRQVESLSAGVKKP